MEKDIFDQLVHTERLRQDNKWGIQDHEPCYWLAILVEEFGELAHAILETEQGPPVEDYHIEEELVQVAAVAKAMYESGKRNGWL